MDLVTGIFPVLSGDTGISVLLGNGDGTFQPPVNYAPGSSGVATVADVNGDGNEDLLALYGDSVGVLLGNGDGTFQAAMNYNAGGGGPISIATGDVNQDGKLDVLVSNPCGSCASPNIGNLGVLLGAGDGSFNTAQTYEAVGFRSSWMLAAGDFNGDGKPDVALSITCIDNLCQSGGVNVFLNVAKPPDFSLTLSSFAPSVIGSGESAGSTVTVGAVDNFSGSIALSCSVKPSTGLSPACALSSSSATAGTAVTLTVQAPVSSGSLRPQLGYGVANLFWVPAIGIVLSSMTSSWKRRGRERGSTIGRVVLVGMLLGGLSMPTGCGDSSSSGGKGSASTTYTVTVGGTDSSGSLKHSAQATIMVE